MGFFRTAAAMVLAAAMVPMAVSAGVETETIKTRILQYPHAPVKGLDYAGLRAEFAFAPVSFGKVETMKTSIPCAIKDPETGRVSLKTTQMLPISYYRVNYQTPETYVVVKDASDKVVYTGQLERFDNWADFGKESCGHMSEDTLAKNWQAGQEAFFRSAEAEEGKSLAGKVATLLNNELFFTYSDERFYLSRAEDKRHDYSELEKAYALAEGAYARLKKDGYAAESLDDLRAAVALWNKAIGEADLADKDARINIKLASRLHENIGVASMFINDYAAARIHLEKSKQLEGFRMVTAGMGVMDLHERSARRRPGYDANKDLSPQEILALLAGSQEAQAKLVPVNVPSSELPRLAAAHKERSAAAVTGAVDSEARERSEAVASGAVNPYADQVAYTALQGHMLSIVVMWGLGTPLDAFPPAICELVQLNQLAMSGHTFTELPECIGELRALKKLDLSKNKLTTLPASIGNLKGLKTLDLKKNDFSDAEQARIKGLLPDTKVKF